MTKKKVAPVSLVLSAEVFVSDVISSLVALSSDQLFKFICDLDDEVADYDFTKKLRDKFVEVVAKCDEESVAWDAAVAASVVASRSGALPK